MTDFIVRPIGHVRGGRDAPTDDYWGGTSARIELVPELPADALLGLDTFSHVEVLFLFDRVAADEITFATRRPRGNPAWPAVGIFAQRGKGRPNRIGTTMARVIAVEGRDLVVGELDALDGTPVLDLKPVLTGFLPRGRLRAPPWATAVMEDYWKPADAGPAVKRNA